MASVDLALHALWRRHALPGELRFFQLYTPTERRPGVPAEREILLQRRHELPFPYELARGRSDEIEQSAGLIFWGDFLQSREYVHQVAATLVEIHAEDRRDEAVRTAYRHLLLSEAAEDVLARTLAFGGTLIFNRARDYQDAGYSAHLARFLRGCRRVWMRDVYSAQRAAAIRGSGGAYPLGVDASLLLHDEDLAPLPRAGCFAGSAHGRAGIFFGRTGARVPALARFARDLCRRLQTEAEWLPWFDPEARPALLPETREAFPAMRVEETPEPPLVGDVLARLGEYDFVVTDTYHLCVNAWRAGVPALCLGSAVSSREPYDVSFGWCCAWRDKRHTFYAMHDAMEYYVFAEELADRTARANRLLYTEDLLREKDLAAAVASTVRSRAAAVEADLVRELSAMTRGAGG
jgi:hypothetical protein